MGARRWAALMVAASPLLMGFALPGAVERLCARGNRLYEAGKYQEAADSYARGLKLRPDDATLHYNQGTALYKAEQFPAAAQAFSAAMADAPQELQQDLHYNIGNTRYRTGDFKGAVEQYKEALRLKADDGEAKYNLEMAQRKLKEQEEQEKQQEDEEKQKQEKEQQEQPSEEQKTEQEEKQAEQEQAEEQQAQQEQAEAQQAQQEEATEKEKEQAAALLRALAAEDAAMQRIIRRAPVTQPREVEKDW
jgi:Ca-activated chloride channel family protein